MWCCSEEVAQLNGLVGRTPCVHVRWGRCRWTVTAPAGGWEETELKTPASLVGSGTQLGLEDSLARWASVNSHPNAYLVPIDTCPSQCGCKSLVREDMEGHPASERQQCHSLSQCHAGSLGGHREGQEVGTSMSIHPGHQGAWPRGGSPAVPSGG